MARSNAVFDPIETCRLELIPLYCQRVALNVPLQRVDMLKPFKCNFAAHR